METKTRRLKVIGTNHLITKEEIYKMIKKENPDIIGVELCDTRFNLMVLPLLNPKEDSFKIDKPKQEELGKNDETLIGKISDSIKRKAEEEDLQYGSDMVNASLYAKENNIPLEFLDLDITRIKALMEMTPEKEQQGFLKELAQFEQMSITEVNNNSNVNDTLLELKTNYPVSFEFLITMRELFVTKNIFKLEHKYPGKKILIIVGEGHFDSIMKEIKE